MSAVPAHIQDNPRLGTWVTVAGGVVEVHVGKVELGQGILTALAQIAADALALPLSGIRMVAAHTTDGPDEGLTAGSLSVLQAGPALRHVGAVVRALAGPTEPRADYVLRIAALDPATDVTAVTPADPVAATSVGRSEARLDLPDKVLGRPSYLADLRPDGLLYGRVLRPPSPGARLAELDEDWKAAGVELVRDGSFVGVVGEREADVDRALEQLRRDTRWDEHDSLPTRTSCRPGSAPARTRRSRSSTTGSSRPRRSARRTPSRSWCTGRSRRASASRSGAATGCTCRSHSQGIHALRDAIAAALGSRARDRGGRARRERRLLRPQRRRRRGVRRRAARPRRAGPPGPGALDPARRAHLGSAVLGDDGHGLGGPGGRPDQPGGRTTCGATGTARARASAVSRGCSPARTSRRRCRSRQPTDPPLVAGGGADPQRHADLRRRPAPRHGSPQGRDTAAILGDASPGRLPQRLRDRELHGRAGRRGRRGPGGVPARPPVGSPRRARGRDRGPALRLDGATAGERRPRARLRALQGQGRLVRGRRRGRGGDRCAGPPADRRRRHRHRREPGRCPQPARGRRDPGDQLDHQGAGPLRPAPHHQRRLGALPDPHLLGGARSSTSTSSTVDRPRRSVPARPLRARPRRRSRTRCTALSAYVCGTCRSTPTPSSGPSRPWSNQGEHHAPDQLRAHGPDGRRDARRDGALRPTRHAASGELRSPRTLPGRVQDVHRLLGRDVPPGRPRPLRSRSSLGSTSPRPRTVSSAATSAPRPPVCPSTRSTTC